MLHRKKPEVIDVLHYVDIPIGKAIGFCNGRAHMTVSANLLVRTPHRVARVHVGDYIVRQEDGVCNVYSPEEFHKIYEVSEEG
ncbi:hypothetical protein [Brochothrix phage ADU4]|nr:hypothetical protein [Brochothrix phage ADU4]